MKRRRVVHLAGTLMAALYLLATSPAAARYTVVSLSDESEIQVGGMVASSTAAVSAVVSADTVTADLAACKNSLGAFAIVGSGGPPNSIQIFKVTQTVAGVLGFSNSSSPPFRETIEIPVPLDSTGNGQSAPFYLKGLEPGQTVVSICNDQQQCPWNQVSSIVVKVDSVEWEAVNSPLDNNPNAGGGLRMFPDKDSMADNADKTAVTVKATISSEFAGKPVYLRAFDVDDPSSDNTVVDRDGAGAIDNHGITSDLNSATGISNATGITDSSGIARMTFHVSKQPGDNFRIAGTCLMPDRDGFTASGVGVKDASGQSLPTDVAKITPMLTVWRRLHIEVDSMGPVTGNTVEGTVTKARPSKTQTVLTLSALPDAGRFETGRIDIETVGVYPVVDSGSGTVTVQGVIASAAVAGKHFTLVDDDDFNDNDGGALDGDMGEELTGPDLSLVQASDLPSENVFAPAYVKPAYDLNNLRPKVPFVLHSLAFYDYFDNYQPRNNSFWTAYLLGAYQWLASEDEDGENVAHWGEGSDSYGASIYLEVGRPLEEATLEGGRYEGKGAFVNQAATTAHELGHWFGAADDNSKNSDPEGGLMCQPLYRKKATFSDKTLATIRNKNKDVS